MILHPLGPFPPVAPREGLDLAVRLADDLFTRDAVAGPVRSGLASALDREVKAGDLDSAADVVAALVDTWPCAALVESARTRPSDADSLALLARVSELVRLAFGWDALGHTVWPCPPAAWITHHAQDARELQRACIDDGAEAIAQALQLPIPGDFTQPGVTRVDGEGLLETREALASALAREEIRAVHVDGGVLPGAATGFALGELEMEGDHQGAWARYGTAGLAVRELGAWTAQLTPPTPGTEEGPLEARCLGAVLPGPPSALRRGEIGRVGWLLWSGPHAPCMVTPRAAGLVVLASRGADGAAMAEALDVEISEVVEGVAALRALGALQGTLG